MTRGLLAACVVLAIAWLTPSLPDPHDKRWHGRDHAKYLAMAAAPETPPARMAPWCYRVLVPRLSRALAQDHVAFFRIASTLAGALALALMVLLFERWGAPPRQALAGAALLALTGPWRDVLHDHYVTDLPMLAFAVALVWLAELRRWPAFAAVLAVACLNRESALGFALIPLAVDRRALWTVIPALLTLLAVRGAVTADSTFGFLDALRLSRFPSLQWLAGVSVRAWGVLLVLAAAVPFRRVRGVVAERPALAAVAALGFVQSLLGHDTQRLAMVAGPFVVWLAIEGMGRLRVERPGALIALIAFQYLLFATDYREPWVVAMVPAFRTLKAVVSVGVLVVAIVVSSRAPDVGSGSSVEP